MRFLLKVIINAVALWLTTFIVSGVSVRPYSDSDTAAVLTYLLIAVIFGVVNAIVGTAIRVVAFPLYIVTLGLISLIVNGLLFLLTSWIADQLTLPFHVDNFWPTAVLGALIVGVVSWLIDLAIPKKFK